MGQAPVFWTLLASGCLVALVWGGGPERVAAAVFALATVASHMLYRPPTERFYQVEIDVLVVDLMVLAAMLGLVVCADRFWPILMSAIAAISVAGHVGRMFDAGWARLTYAIAITAPSYLTVLVLVTAVVRHRLRLQQGAHEQAWNSAVIGAGSRRG